LAPDCSVARLAKLFVVSVLIKDGLSRPHGPRIDLDYPWGIRRARRVPGRFAAREQEEIVAIQISQRRRSTSTVVTAAAEAPERWTARNGSSFAHDSDVNFSAKEAGAGTGLCSGRLDEKTLRPASSG
jgi:hypothetical protein